jgi:hypothetical protein
MAQTGLVLCPTPGCRAWQVRPHLRATQAERQEGCLDGQGHQWNGGPPRQPQGVMQGVQRSCAVDQHIWHAAAGSGGLRCGGCLAPPGTMRCVCGCSHAFCLRPTTAASSGCRAPRAHCLMHAALGAGDACDCRAAWRGFTRSGVRPARQRAQTHQAAIIHALNCSGRLALSPVGPGHTCAPHQGLQRPHHVSATVCASNQR